MLRLKAYLHKALLSRLIILAIVLVSLLGSSIPNVATDDGMDWLVLACIVIGGTLTIAAGYLEIKSYHPTMQFDVGADSDINSYLKQWISTGGRVLISTRDMSWANERDAMSLLEDKAESDELTVVLPASIDKTDTLKERGATIHTYGREGAEAVLATRFTIVNYGRSGSRVAIGWRSGGKHLIREYSAVDDDPIFELVQDVVMLATER